MHATSAKWISFATSLLLAGTLACTPYGHRSYSQYQQGRPGFFPVAVSAGLTVDMPGAPQLSEERHRAGDGTLFTTTQAEVAMGYPPMIFRAIVTEFEGGLTGDLMGQLDEVVELFIEDAEGTEIRSAIPIETQGFPGVEHEIFEAENRIVLRIRHYIGRKRIYTVGVAYSEQLGAGGTATADHFFERLTFDAADAPIPAGDGTLDLRRFTHVFPPRDDFAIEMPGLARTAMEPMDPFAATQETRVYGVRDAAGALRFEMRVTRLGNVEIGGLLPRMRDRRLSNGYRIRDARDTHRQGFAALAVTYESATDVVFVLYILTMSRLYEASVTVPVAREAEIVPYRQRFFQSLRVL